MNFDYQFGNEYYNYYDDKGIKSKKYKIIITVAAVIILCIVGIYLVNNLKSNNVYAKKVTFDIAYEKEGLERRIKPFRS